MSTPITLPETGRRIVAVVRDDMEIRQLEILGYVLVAEPATPHRPTFRPVVADGTEGITIDEYVDRHSDLKFDYIYIRRLHWDGMTRDWS